MALLPSQGEHRVVLVSGGIDGSIMLWTVQVLHPDLHCMSTRCTTQGGLVGRIGVPGWMLREPNTWDCEQSCKAEQPMRAPLRDEAPGGHPVPQGASGGSILGLLTRLPVVPLTPLQSMQPLCEPVHQRSSSREAVS